MGGRKGHKGGVNRKSKGTSVKSYWLGEHDGPVEGDQDRLLVGGATDLLLESVAQPDPRSEISHLVKV